MLTLLRSTQVCCSIDPADEWTLGETSSEWQVHAGPISDTVGCDQLGKTVWCRLPAAGATDQLSQRHAAKITTLE